MLIPSSAALTLTKESEKRLQVIQENSVLGSGFTLAFHDLEIRGSGNVVGEEQSGYIKDIGFELYQNLLECSLLMMPPDKHDFSYPQINIGVPVMIPISYINDNNLRMNMYRRIGDLNSFVEIENMELELTYRFGPLPKELLNLLSVMKIKIFCKRGNIEKIDIGKKGVSISFNNNICNNPEKLLSFVKENQNIIRITPDQKLIITNFWKDVQERTKYILNIVKKIGEM
jgi:transcription-repair coupling factor (superfamily II helicase)